MNGHFLKILFFKIFGVNNEITLLNLKIVSNVIWLY